MQMYNRHECISKWGNNHQQRTSSYLTMRLLLLISLISMLSSFRVYSQEIIKKDEFSLNGVQIFLYKYSMVETDKGVCEVSSNLRLVKAGKQVYQTQICSVELSDVEVLEKGYLTVIRHYSSPVGWSKAYIIDLCKGRLIETKELNEGLTITWNDFIELSSATREKYVKSITNF